MTKWKGQAASYAPFVTLGVCVFSAMPLDAALADCTNVGVNWTCSATTVTSQTINTNGAIVTTDPGFNLTVPSGQALTIQAQGALSYTDTNSSAIVSNGSGTALYMQATNLGATPGSTTINSNGNFTGTSGIEVENSANGHSNVTLSGQITATGAGVGVQVRSGWGDININVAPAEVITSGGIGINTDQTGPGTTTINASGEVSGDNVGISGDDRLW